MFLVFGDLQRISEHKGQFLKYSRTTTILQFKHLPNNKQQQKKKNNSKNTQCEIPTGFRLIGTCSAMSLWSPAVLHKTTHCDRDWYMIMRFLAGLLYVLEIMSDQFMTF